MAKTIENAYNNTYGKGIYTGWLKKTWLSVLEGYPVKIFLKKIYDVFPYINIH